MFYSLEMKFILSHVHFLIQYAKQSPSNANEGDIYIFNFGVQ